MNAPDAACQATAGRPAARPGHTLPARRPYNESARGDIKILHRQRNRYEAALGARAAKVVRKSHRAYRSNWEIYR